ncbi:restriction endonuclease-like protein [Salipaludibacillus aurantiacus]|uniref:DUF2357 domain-containing protein n=1 Tax=Salipaludibacillus aurantiacus TaxID=1601833 RepID=A0A1H9UVW3_9BACI|nr:restriction endonuclease-like protein [Salipaludibacillus aurantiacus]SES13143.1 hypothetical protein SAMN05518684_108189 [Salipaludibacillus aurantiacus]
MGSRHSGSTREEVELVVIETDSCSLVIKGKPYHERYEGLSQYRQMDFHDVMEFDVTGEAVTDVKIYDVNEQKLTTYSRQRPIFFENTVYQIIVSPKGDNDLSFYHEHPSLRKAVSKVEVGTSYILMGNLQFQNEVGFTTFSIKEEEDPILQVTLEIFPAKLDYKNDYKKLIDEVNEEIYNLAFHFLKKTYMGSSIKLDGNPSMTEFFRLITFHFEAFFKAIERIERQPHHQLKKLYMRARGDQLRRLDSRVRNDLRKNPSVFVDVPGGVRVDGRTLLPSKGLNIKKELTYDTLENRYVKWMIKRLIMKLEDLKVRLSVKRKWEESEANSEARGHVSDMIDKLEKKLISPFWRRIGQLDRSIMSLVLQMAPGYRDAFQIYLTVSKGLALQGRVYQMSVKDVATLYEYWTFLKLGQLLQRKYKQMSQDIIKVSRVGLFVNLDTSRSAKRVFAHPITGERIELAYQKVERNPTTVQKPDSMLSITKKGKDYTFNYVFDAKYRIDFATEGTYYGDRYKSAGPLEEDINTMHRYRDSIVAGLDGPYERTSFGAYVLFPWGNEEVYEDHHFYQSIDKVNIGGLPFLPSATTLVEQFVDRLIEKSPEEIQAEGILPRGAKDEWESAFDDKVLVGVIGSAEDYDRSMKQGELVIETSKLRGGWQQAKYVAVYVKQGVGLENGVRCFGKIRDVNVEGAYLGVVRFEVDSWKNTNPVIKPVGYGIAGAMMTTMAHLREAKELPELFMKSAEEMTVWRTLRRVSDRVKVELDHEVLDEAKHVQSYRFKDVEVRMDYEWGRIEVVKGKSSEIISFDELRRRPSVVFKTVVKLL